MSGMSNAGPALLVSGDRKDSERERWLPKGTAAFPEYTGLINT